MVEKLLSVFFLVISLVYTYYAGDLSFGTFMAPKAGFLPMISGGIAILLALVMVIKPLRSECTGGTVKVNWRKLIFIILGLAAYLTLFKLVGYMMATLIIMVYLLKMMDTPGWMAPGLLSTVIAIGFYFVFEKLLGSKLP